MSKINVVLVGAGARGKDVYSKYILNNPEVVNVVAVLEPNEEKREMTTIHPIKVNGGLNDVIVNIDEFIKERLEN
ncbi:hypothetical protein [Clostridium sp.]|uniref:hypothetical protein n=1 Tax=Clostridium sp. TaxID=1506 RepID=UPI00261C740E|nr:hypothetical protein [Clostridium sp.]